MTINANHEHLAAITVAGVTKQYRTTTAVENVSFSVPRGSVTALLGPNGAGKTTLLSMILGLVRPTSGAIEFRDGESTTIGASLDGGWFASGLKAADDWAYASAVLGVPPQRAAEVRRAVGIDDRALGRSVAKFSTGMKQRHGLGIALLGEPDILVLDEPVNGLDPDGIRWLRDVISDYAAQGGTVLLSSHLLGEVAHVADHVVVVNRTLRFAGSVEELDSLAAGDLETQYFDLVSERSLLCVS